MPDLKIWWDTTVDAYRVTTPYRREFVEAIKLLVPVSDRSFDSVSKTWTVTERYLDPIRSLAKQVYGQDPTVLTKANAQQAQTPSAIKSDTLDTAFIKFMRLLPYDAAQKAYRLAAMEFHPDRGGDMTKMSSLNALWTKLETEWYKR